MTAHLVTQTSFFECPECHSRTKIYAQVRNGLSSSNVECVDCNVYMEKIEKPQDYKDPIKSQLETIEDSFGETEQ